MNAHAPHFMLYVLADEGLLLILFCVSDPEERICFGRDMILIKFQFNLCIKNGLIFWAKWNVPCLFLEVGILCILCRQLVCHTLWKCICISLLRRFGWFNYIWYIRNCVHIFWLPLIKVSLKRFGVGTIQWTNGRLSNEFLPFFGTIRF